MAGFWLVNDDLRAMLGASMKTSRIILTVCLLALACAFAVPSTIAAEKAEKPKKEKKVGPRILKKFDKDGDGQLNDEERAEWEADKARKREERKAKKAAEQKAGEQDDDDEDEDAPSANGAAEKAN